eukprot:3446711-Ditylum_brightwellii.AAC.1
MPFVKILGSVTKITLEDEESGCQCYLSKGTLSALLELQNSPVWEDLIPQLVWRGTDYQFLEQFDL